ncbi:MAG: M23 family metallopeptidase [Odoribacter sp.]|nr:M23 family metallopeptidase [Odoribacter sp.]
MKKKKAISKDVTCTQQAAAATKPAVPDGPVPANDTQPDESPRRVSRSRKRARVSTPRRYRLELINDNTLSRVWQLKFKGIWALIAAGGALAAIASLIAMIFMFTPLGQFLPGRLKGDLRSQYIEMALRVDSLENVAREQSAYTANIVAILTDSLPDPVIPDARQPGAAVVDSLISAGDAEQRFVKQFEEEQRFNLSVLSPIAAEGMIFESPSETDTGAGPVAAVYRGTVVSLITTDDGFTTAVVQHPGDFISVYADLDECYIDRGDKVVAGQRIGHSTPGRPLLFELWHAGIKLDPALYIYN